MTIDYTEVLRILRSLDITMDYSAVDQAEAPFSDTQAPHLTTPFANRLTETENTPAGPSL